MITESAGLVQLGGPHQAIRHTKADLDRTCWGDLVLEGVEARRTRDGAQWRLGDLALEVTTTYGGRELERYADEIGVEYKTLLNYRTIAGRIESSRRRENLSFSHHACVAAAPLSPNVVDALLQRAEEECWPVRRLQLETEAAVIRSAADRRRQQASERWSAPRRRTWSKHVEDVERFVSALYTLNQCELAACLSHSEVAALIPPEDCADLRQRLAAAIKFLRAFAVAWKPHCEGDSKDE